MNALDGAIKKALDLSGCDVEANKVYLEFIKANFIIPIEKDSSSEEPRVLFLQENNYTFLPVFTELTHFDNWALSIADSVQLLKLSGVDLLKGIAEDVIVCLNIGTNIYKEFNPSELARMRSLVLKLFK